MKLNWMTRTRWKAPALALAFAVSGVSAITLQAGEKALFETDFEEAEPGTVPDEFLVLDGGFAVKEADGNRFLELPGAPLSSFGFLFGPAEKSGLEVTARIQAEGRGRRYPAFGIGLNGVVGYRLFVAPAKQALELYKGDTVEASAPLEWDSGTWTRLRLRVREAGGGVWKVEGRIWKDGEPEPEGWMITWEEKEEPINGRASAWGSPYSGRPIRYDDLVVGRIETNR
jgi:hypothetical protein